MKGRFAEWLQPFFFPRAISIYPQPCFPTTSEDPKSTARSTVGIDDGANTSHRSKTKHSTVGQRRAGVSGDKQRGQVSVRYCAAVI